MTDQNGARRETLSRIAEYTRRADFGTLDDGIVEHAVNRLLDTLACAVGGQESDLYRTVVRTSADAGVGSGHVLGSAMATGTDDAAFLNTCMIRALDWNDQFPHSHPSDTVGALLAMAPALKSDGRKLLSALTVGYEVNARVTRASKLRKLGWDQGFSIGIAATAASAHLLDLPEEQTRHALAIMASSNMHLRAVRSGRLSMWKGAATALAVRNAVFAVRLAGAGVTGPDDPVEGVDGLWDRVTGPFELEPFPTEGGHHLMPDTLTKYWPAVTGAQAAVWAARRLAESVAVSDISAVRLGTTQAVKDDTGTTPDRWDPHNAEAADHSLPYIFVKALLDGGITHETFTPGQYLEPALRPLMQRVTVEFDEVSERATPGRIRLRCTVDTSDGRTIEFWEDDPKGSRANPMTRGDIAEKFQHIVTPSLGAAASDRLLRFWSDTPDHSDLGPGWADFVPTTERPTADD